MTFVNFLTAAAVLDCLVFVVNLPNKIVKRYEGFIAVGLMGLTILVAGGIITVAGVMKAKERYILLYMLFESILLLIVTIYSGMLVFNALYLVVVVMCGLLWFGIYGLYGFYLEMANYNSVKSEVYEISYTNNVDVYGTNSSNQVVEHTAV